ncbi:hypothetical protein LEP1GSC172_0176 [Leptospira noguchii]|uniref:Uncharacterized protein n=2 Tax=Leptospira noguchii TaxID=28182 RepID=T0GX80_9LEPT|nr:hypothetical protein LEP1GSC172_0176 [Leptospira noguchii]EQA71951.1 hypothetical protein LEP1GSC059_0948 [Leptospira noguchii serovar Panama str. CZ214]
MSSIIIHFSEKSRDLNFVDRFLKCESYCKISFGKYDLKSQKDKKDVI